MARYFDGRDVKDVIEGFAHAIKNRQLTKETSIHFIENLKPDQKWKNGALRYLQRSYLLNFDNEKFENFIHFCTGYLHDNRFYKNFTVFFEALLETYNREDPILTYYILDKVLLQTLGYKTVDRIVELFLEDSEDLL